MVRADRAPCRAGEVAVRIECGHGGTPGEPQGVGIVASDVKRFLLPEQAVTSQPGRGMRTNSCATCPRHLEVIPALLGNRNNDLAVIAFHLLRRDCKKIEKRKKEKKKKRNDLSSASKFRGSAARS